MTQEDLKYLTDAIIKYRDAFDPDKTFEESLLNVGAFQMLTGMMTRSLIHTAGYDGRANYEADHPFVVEVKMLFAQTSACVHAGIEIGMEIARLRSEKSS